MEQLIILIVAGIIGLANYLVKKSRENSDGFNSTPPPAVRRPSVQQRPIVPEESDEERMRRFLEALGVPANPQPPRTIERPAPAPQAQRAQPARSVARAPVQPVRKRPRVVQSSPPPIPVRQPELEPVVAEKTATPMEPETVFSDITAIPSEPAPLPVSATAAISVAAVPAVDPLGILAMLRNPANLRAAIVLREVMGPPRGLEPYR